jgi:hypothetical protein
MVLLIGLFTGTVITLQMAQTLVNTVPAGKWDASSRQR